MSSNKKWSLLKNGKKIHQFGFILLLLLMVFIPLQIHTGYFSTFIMILFFGYIMGAAIFIFSGSAFANLYKIVENIQPEFTLERFKALPQKIIIKNTENREFMILYHSLVSLYTFWIYIRYFILFTWDIPPEHYQVWTPLGKLPINVKNNRYNYLEWVRPYGLKRLFAGIMISQQKEIVFDNELREVASHLHQEAKEISTLLFVGFAKESGKPILLALLAQTADSSHISKTLILLEKIAIELKRYYDS